MIWLGLTFDDRDAHRDVIDARIDAMLAAGWLGETEALMARYGPQAHALCATHGYPELMRVAQGEWTLPQAVASIRTQIHQYARRQRTWFRRNGEIHWIARDTMTQDEVLQAALDRLSSAAIV